jgi:hypothetical protein
MEAICIRMFVECTSGDPRELWGIACFGSVGASTGSIYEPRMGDAGFGS